MQSNRERRPTINGFPVPPKQLDNGLMSPSSNYGIGSPGYDDTGFQAMDSRLTYSSFAPPTNVMLEDVKNGLGNPVAQAQADRAGNSALLDMNDSVSLHLLVETAMGDSQEYEILSYDQVDAIKNEFRELQPRIEAASKRLALESKVRDAAQSLGRLSTKKKENTQGSPKRNRRSMSNRSSTGSVKFVTDSKSENELALLVKKCEDLARDLWQLESRSRQLQTQLLKHTAGILQMTHAGPTKKEAMRSLPDGPNTSGRPDSPQSIYNYDTSRRARNSQFEDAFDERSLYRSPENLDNLMRALKTGSHNTQIDELNDNIGNSQAIQAMESRLEELNDRLRDLIVRANPERNQNYTVAPRKANDNQEPIVDRQLDFLDQAIRDISSEQVELQKQSRHSQSEVEGRLEGVNNQICDIINNLQSPEYEPYPPPPRISGRNMQEQIAYLQEAMYSLEQTAASRPTPAASGDVSQYEATLTGLWSIIQAGEEEARQRKRQRRQQIAANPDGLDQEEDLSPDEDANANEEFTLQAFSTKVQWLYSSATKLREQQGILRRQIRQQRDLNNKSDVQQEGEVQKLKAHIEDLESDLTSIRDDARIEASEMQANLQEASEKIEQLTRNLRGVDSDRQVAETNYRQAEGLLTAKDDELRELEGKVAELQTEVTIARAELDGAYGTRAQRAAEVASNPQVQKELENLANMNKTLREELKGMAGEYEALTRDSIQNEKDRESLEGLIDSLRDEKEKLELELSDEKVRWLGARSPGSAPQSAEMTSVRMMREDFKKMMREKTTEALKALRAEQEERRKLEGLVRQLRKESLPKSGLKQSMSAS